MKIIVNNVRVVIDLDAITRSPPETAVAQYDFVVAALFEANGTLGPGIQIERINGNGTVAPGDIHVED